MKELPLLNALIEYQKENNLILSMPGNKCGKAFLKDDIGEYFKNNLGNLDITEVDPLDNLHNPEGVIKESQELLRKYYGAKKAFFMVNGSTNGNLAAIFSAFNEGDEVLVERNCHKSIYNALILRRLKVIYIEPSLMEKEGISLPPNNKNILDALKRCKAPKGIILTYPNYYGITFNIEKTILALKEKGLKVIIDGAHGAHFNTTESLPKSISSLGDYVVLSAHKTLPALTGGAFLLVNTKDPNIEFYVSSFMTTSPSYLIMASLDYSRYYLEKYGKEDYENLIALAEKWKEFINSLDKVKILSKKDLPRGYDLDKTRYIMTLEEGFNGHFLLDILRQNNIQCEMSYQKGVVMILSPSNTKEDFEKIYDAIKALDMDTLRCPINKSKYISCIPEKSLEPYEVFNKEWEYKDINFCSGRISKDFIIPYPPGIPIVCPGEVINDNVIKLVNEYLFSYKTVIGVNNDKKCRVII